MLRFPHRPRRAFRKNAKRIATLALVGFFAFAPPGTLIVGFLLVGGAIGVFTNSKQSEPQVNELKVNEPNEQANESNNVPTPTATPTPTPRSDEATPQASDIKSIDANGASQGATRREKDEALNRRTRDWRTRKFQPRTNMNQPE